MNFYFYDLETTGLDPFRDRIMQFAGLRTDADLKPLGEVEEFYVKLSEDILPGPQAIAAHGILPQTANLEGLSEYQFLNWLEKEAYQSETIYSGYNNADFDDQFMRWLHWRNFAEPAPMTLAGGSFDIYRLIRLAADLRPEGLKWPEGINGRRPSLTLTALTAANGISHQGAHRAGADVEATLELARRLKEAQPKLFDHFLQLLQVGFRRENNWRQSLSSFQSRQSGFRRQHHPGGRFGRASDPQRLFHSLRFAPSTGRMAEVVRLRSQFAPAECQTQGPAAAALFDY